MAVSSPVTHANLGIPCEVSEIDVNELSYIDNIGGGGYGAVRKAMWRNELVAVKQYYNARHMNFFANEVRELSRNAHPNIVVLYAISIQKQLLVLQYSEMGSLQDILDQSRYIYSAGHAVSWARQAADGIAYLHKSKVLHRDVKPDNMLLFDEGRLLKLTDFVRVLRRRERLAWYHKIRLYFQQQWMAPEVFNSNNYNQLCDVYSWDIVFWQIISRRQPFEDQTTFFQIMEKVMNGGRPPMVKKCPTIIQNLITDCWCQDSWARPSMSAVAKRMAVLQKLYPNNNEPLIVVELRQDSETQSEDPGCNTISAASSVSNIFNGVPEGIDGRDSGSYHADFELVPPPKGSSSSSSSSTATLVSGVGSNSLNFTMQRLVAAGLVEKNSSPTISPSHNTNSPPVSLSETDRKLLEPILTGGRFASIQAKLQDAFKESCTRIRELRRIKREMAADLERNRTEVRTVHQRQQQFLQISAENEDLMNNLLPLVLNDEDYVVVL